MTNREQWEHELRQMSDENFAALMLGGRLPDGSELQTAYGKRFCAWCEAVNGPCVSADDEPCPVRDDDYLRAEVIE